MKRIIAGSLAFVVALFLVSVSPVLATDIIEIEEVNDTGYVLRWDFTANNSGVLTAETDRPMVGMLYRAYIEPHPTNPIANTMVVTIQERIAYGQTSSTLSTDLAGGTLTASTGAAKAVEFWPADSIPVGSNLYLSMTGALNAGGTGAQGRVCIIVNNNAANHE